MEKESLEVSVVLPVKPEQLYYDWLNSEAHSKFTGGEAEVSPELGIGFYAWDGYISGKNLELEFPSRILQSWRTTEFSEEDEDSMLEITIKETTKGSMLRLKHWNIPSGQGAQYKSGWQEHYFEPMKEYYS